MSDASLIYVQSVGNGQEFRDLQLYFPTDDTKHKVIFNGLKPSIKISNPVDRLFVNFLQAIITPNH